MLLYKKMFVKLYKFLMNIETTSYCKEISQLSSVDEERLLGSLEST